MNRLTMTTLSSRNDTIALSCMDFSGYAGYVTIFSRMLTIAYCLEVGLQLGLGLDLVSGWLVVMHAYLLLLSLSQYAGSYVPKGTYR